jgi:serine/threonine protein kinase
VNREYFQKVRRIFDAAVQISPIERPAFIREACEGDPALLEQVEELLKSHEDANSLLRTGAISVASLVAGVRLEPGHVLGGRFEIVRLLGRGGMGEVYEARDEVLRRTVALKMLPGEQADDSLFRQRLQREARALAALKHPNICAIHDVARYDGQDVLVIEYLEGETLASRLRRAGKLSLPDAVQITIQICKALDYAHSRGLIHRDLKPANIMLTAEGVKLLDFGIAHFSTADATDVKHATGAVRGDAPVTATLTGHAGVVGTVQYMSPEQVSGEPLDGRSDLFSLGVVLYEMATSSTPFPGNSPSEVLHAVLHSLPASPRQFNGEIPVDLQDAICKCLEKSRHLRFSSAAELEQVLQTVQSDPAFSSGDSERVPFTPANKRTKMWAIAATASLLLAIPAYRLFDVRSMIPLNARRDAAITNAKRWAADLKFSTEGLREYIAFNPIVDLHAVGAAAGLDGMRRIVQSSRALAWEIDFTPDASRRLAPDRDPGVSVRLDCAGRLVEFQRPGVPLRRTLQDVRSIVSSSVSLIATSFQLNGLPNGVVDSGSFSGSVPTGVRGWDEHIRVQWSEDRDFTRGGGQAIVPGELLLLSRRILPQPGVLSIDGDLSPIVLALHNVQTILKRQVPIIFYVFSIWMLFRHRHSLKWLPALPLAALVAAFAIFAPYVYPESVQRHVSKDAASFRNGVVVFALAVPAITGVFAWLRSRHYAVVIGFEQLLHGRISGRAAGSSLADGVLAGFLMAGIYLLKGTLSGGLFHVPDVSSVMTAIRADSPWIFPEVSLGFMAPAVVLGLAILFHAARRVARNDLAAIVATSALSSLATVDLLSPDVITAFPFGSLAFGWCLVVYRTVGLAGAILAQLTAYFIVAGIVGVHLDNASFARASMPLLQIPLALIAVAIVAGYLGKARTSAARA